MAAWNTFQMSDWNPHRFTEAGSIAGQLARLETVVGDEPAGVAVGVDLPALVEGHEEAVGPHRADPPGDGIGGGHRGLQLVADEHVLVGRRPQLVGQHAHGHLAVDVVGVAHGERRRTGQGVLGGQHGVHGTERQALLGEARRPPTPGQHCSTW